MKTLAYLCFTIVIALMGWLLWSFMGGFIGRLFHDDEADTDEAGPAGRYQA